MNREQRRKFNKQNKTKFTKEDFDLMLAMERLKQGNVDLNELSDLVPKKFLHIDNVNLAPNGTECKLNFEGLEQRIKSTINDSTNVRFREWVDEMAKDKEKIFHLTREGSEESLVCLEEDNRTVELDGKEVPAPKWMFDLYSDLLLKDPKDEQWKVAGLIDEDFKNYVPVNVIKKED